MVIGRGSAGDRTPNLPTNIVGFRGFDSSTILIQRGGIPRPIGDLPESSSRAMSVGKLLIGGLGVPRPRLWEGLRGVLGRTRQPLEARWSKGVLVYIYIYIYIEREREI